MDAFCNLHTYAHIRIYPILFQNLYKSSEVNKNIALHDLKIDREQNSSEHSMYSKGVN